MLIRRFALFLLTLPILILSSGAPTFAAGTSAGKDKVVVYYFHETVRCSTCLEFEAFSKTTLDTYFSKDLKNGRLEWHVLDMDAPQNKHFVKQFKLFTKALVIEKVHDGKVVAWKNLEDIWTYEGDKPEFMNYVRHAVAGYL
jgi:hypothetical protein